MIKQQDGKWFVYSEDGKKRLSKALDSGAEAKKRLAEIEYFKSNSETYKPTEAMAAAARKALEIRDKQPESNKGMTLVGLTRARQLIAREELSIDTVKRMYSFFSRHEVDKQGEGWGKDSKGYQAWLGWGGDAGYNWAKQIVEKAQRAQNMTINQIMINSTVRKSQIVDNGNHWLIKGIPVTVDNAEMNGIVYSADENSKGLPTINQKPITGGHPVKDGYPISVNEDMPEWYIGSNVVKSYNVNGVNYVDVKASKKMMRNSENSLGAYFADKLERKESFGVSTGLNLVPVTNEAGEVLATNQRYDHLAFLHDNERPAGGDNTMVRFNADSGVMVVNIDSIIGSNDNGKEKTMLNTIMEKFAQFLGINSETSLDERRSLIESELNKGKTDNERWLWPTDVYSDYFIYKQDGKLMKQMYMIEDGQIAFAGNPMVVVKKVEYEPPESDFGNNKKTGYNTGAQANNHEDDSMSDNNELLQAINALQETLKAQGEQLTSVMQSNAEMKGKMDKMEADAEAEKKAKAAKDAEAKKMLANKLGIDEAEAEKMSINTLEKLTGVNAPITVNAAGGYQGKQEESIFGANYFQELEVK